MSFSIGGAGGSSPTQGSGKGDKKPDPKGVFKIPGGEYEVSQSHDKVSLVTTGKVKALAEFFETQGQLDSAGKSLFKQTIPGDSSKVDREDNSMSESGFVKRQADALNIPTKGKQPPLKKEKSVSDLTIWQLAAREKMGVVEMAVRLGREDELRASFGDGLSSIRSLDKKIKSMKREIQREVSPGIRKQVSNLFHSILSILGQMRSRISSLREKMKSSSKLSDEAAHLSEMATVVGELESRLQQIKPGEECDYNWQPILDECCFINEKLGILGGN